MAFYSNMYDHHFVCNDECVLHLSAITERYTSMEYSTYIGTIICVGGEVEFDWI